MGKNYPVPTKNLHFVYLLYQKYKYIYISEAFVMNYYFARKALKYFKIRGRSSVGVKPGAETRDQA